MIYLGKEVVMKKIAMVVSAVALVLVIIGAAIALTENLVIEE